MTYSNSVSEREMLKHFFELSIDLLCVAGADGYLKQVNPAFGRVLGYDRETLLTQPFISFIHQEDQALTEAEVARLSSQAGETTIAFQNRWLHRDGFICWLEWNVTVVVEGEETLFYAVARDITARKQAEAERQRLRDELDVKTQARVKEISQDLELYADLVKHLPLPINVWQLKDPDDSDSLTLMASNPAALNTSSMLGDSLGKTMLEAYPSLDSADVERHAQVARRQIPNQHYQIPYQDDQISGIYEVRLFPLPRHSMAVAFEDISHQIHLTQRLRTSEALFRTVFQQAPVGMARMAVDGHWLELNDKLCEILGYSASELHTKTFVEITHPADHKQDETYYNQFIGGEIDTCVFEKRYLHAQGHSVWTNVSVSALRKDNGELDGFVVTIQDINKRKSIEAESRKRSRELRLVNRRLERTARMLEQRNEELQQFAYVVSHDLKAPLRAISSLSDWLEEDLADTLPADSKKHLQLIRKRIDRMGGLLDGLLNYSRVGRQHAEIETISVQMLLQDIIESLAVPEGMQIEIKGEMPELETRRFSLSQVFTNLISNGLKHCDRPDGHIRISVKETEEYYQFLVQDNGPGIDPRHHEKIFTIFQTLQPRDKVESTGVGLAIVKKILDTEGGMIEVASTPGEGATFSFTWPKESIVSDAD